MSQGPIDQSIFGELREATGADFVDELVETFLEEAPAMLADLANALDTGDTDRFRRAAHSIKSNANVFGAHAVADLARQLELGGLSGDPAADRSRVTALVQAYDQAAAALGMMRNG